MHTFPLGRCVRSLPREIVGETFIGPKGLLSKGGTFLFRGEGVHGTPYAEAVASFPAVEKHERRQNRDLQDDQHPIHRNSFDPIAFTPIRHITDAR
jgi:hypothetical protein